MLQNMYAVIDESQRAVAGIVLDACGDCKLHGLFCAKFGDYGIWLRNSYSDPV